MAETEKQVTQEPRHRGRRQTPAESCRYLMLAVAAPMLTITGGGIAASAVALDQPAIAIGALAAAPVPVVLSAKRSRQRRQAAKHGAIAATSIPAEQADDSTFQLDQYLAQRYPELHLDDLDDNEKIDVTDKSTTDNGTMVITLPQQRSVDCRS